MMRVTPLSEGAVQGFLHQPEAAGERGLVLTHGAGGNCTAPLLVMLAQAFCETGYWVLRCNLLFRQKKPFGPPSPAAAADDRAGLRDAVAAMRKIARGQVLLGGHSYGGRQSTILAAETHDVAEGLLLLSYPLHPPGKPGQLRTAHFPSLRTPALFVHGTKDPFGTTEELRAALTLIPAKTELIEVDGAGHDLKRAKFHLAGTVIERLASIASAPATRRSE